MIIRKKKKFGGGGRSNKKKGRRSCACPHARYKKNEKRGKRNRKWRDDDEDDDDEETATRPSLIIGQLNRLRPFNFETKSPSAGAHANRDTFLLLLFFFGFFLQRKKKRRYQKNNTNGEGTQRMRHRVSWRPRNPINPLQKAHFPLMNRPSLLELISACSLIFFFYLHSLVSLIKTTGDQLVANGADGRPTPPYRVSYRSEIN